MSHRYSIFELIEEAHSHGRGHVKVWTEEKSFHEFLMQYNLISEYNSWKQKKNKNEHPKIAKSLQKKGHTIREIAQFLGYKHPGSVSHLLSRKTSKP